MQNLLNAINGVAYVVDANATIIAYGRTRWNDFAINNNAPELISESAILGQNLFTFINGDEVKAAYHQYFDVLSENPADTISFAFRCDSPSVRRQLVMTITALRERDTLKGFLLHSTVLDEQYRPPLNIFDFKALQESLADDRKREIVTICSYCLQLRWPPSSSNQDGYWIEAEDYYRLGGSAEVRVSHGICPNCFETNVRSKS